MLIIDKNGKRTVLTGWQAWLAAALLFIGLTLVMALIAFVLLGAAVTMGAVLLILIPVALIVGLLAALSRKRP